MSSPKVFRLVLLARVVLLVVLGVQNQANAQSLNPAIGQGLRRGFYRKSCPAVESTIRKVTAKYVLRDLTLAASLLRLPFHDCFVRGCDASLLLNSTENNRAEKDSLFSRTLRGFHVIDAVKSAVEGRCPGVVSCADILAIVVRDAVHMVGGPTWKVPTGRRDGVISKDADPASQIPLPSGNITKLKSAFLAKGLYPKDLVVLSGSHTIGVSHCSSIEKRLYNFTGHGDRDPGLDPAFANRLTKLCKPGDTITVVPMDPGSPRFDSDYYSAVMSRRGLFQSDAALLDDGETGAYVRSQAAGQGGASQSQGSSFRKDFGKSMKRMGRIGVITGTEGEIRKTCAFVSAKIG